MNRILKYSLVLLPSLLLSCTWDRDDASAGPIAFGLRLDGPVPSKVTLENPLSLHGSERLWRWDEGDVPSVIYVKDGNELTVPAASYAIDESDRSVMKVSPGENPSGASLKGASFGSSNAFGKSCTGDEDIPSSMVYAKATFSSTGNAAVLPDLVLRHQCSYLLVVPDEVDGERMTSFTVTGTGLKGGTSSQTIRLSFKDPEGDAYVAKWVSVCNTATDLTITVTAGGQSYEMASLADAGKGKCNLYYVRNTSIGVEYK